MLRLRMEPRVGEGNELRCDVVAVVCEYQQIEVAASAHLRYLDATAATKSGQQSDYSLEDLRIKSHAALSSNTYAALC